MGEVPTFLEVIALLAQGVGTGAVIAFLFEKFGWFEKLSANAKYWLIFGLSVGLPVAAQAALQFIPPDIWAVLEPWWRALALGFLSWAGSQVAHKLVNKAFV